MRILHVITDLETGGAESMLRKLVLHERARGTQSAVVSLSGVGDFGAEMRANAIPVHVLDLRRRRIAGVPSALADLRAICRSYAPDVVQSWLYHADLAALTMKSVNRRTPVVWNVRCSFTYSLNGLAVRLCARLSGVPSAVVVNSEAGRRLHVEAGYRPRRWELIPNGFETDVFRPDPSARAAIREELHVDDRAILIGLVARVDPLKDHCTFIEAAGRLSRRRNDIVFVLVGAGTDADASLSASISQHGIVNRVRRLGRRDDVHRVTAALDIATCSSIAEGFPNIVGEAMACAVPCVVTDVGDSAAIVGSTGLTVPPGDPEALADAWQTAIEWGAAYRQTVGHAARERVESLYSLGAVADRYADLYRDLLRHESRST